MARIPKPKAAAATDQFAPFLKVSHLGKAKKGTIVLLGQARHQDGAFGPQIIVRVKHLGKEYDLAFSVDSGNHRRLFDRFGANPKKWKGSVKVGAKEFNKNPYVAVLD